MTSSCVRSVRDAGIDVLSDVGSQKKENSATPEVDLRKFGGRHEVKPFIENGSGRCLCTDLEHILPDRRDGSEKMARSPISQQDRRRL